MSNDTYTGGVLIISTCVLTAILGLLVVRRYSNRDTLKQCHDVGGQFLAIVGTMYAVLLGLVVVDAMNKFQKASLCVEQEANSLADIFLLSDKFPAPTRERLRSLCLDYSKEVIDHEWQLMDYDKVYEPAQKTAITLIKATTEYEPKTESEKAVYPIVVQEACQLWDNRRARSNLATRGMPTIEWVVLLVGGIVTVIFTYFFYIDSLRTQVAMTTMVALIIALNLFLVLLFAYPFSGDLTVSPDSFQVDQLIFSNRLGLKVSPTADRNKM